MQVSGSNPFYSASSFFNSASNPVTVTGTDANGNVEGVTASGVKVLADATGVIAGFSIGDVLTAADKAATGYDPTSSRINELAIAVAHYRASGMLTGNVSASFIDALKQSIAKGGYPTNPATLMAKGAPQAPLASDTFASLLSIFNSTPGEAG